MYRIAITNDDGIESPGLKSVAEALLPLGELIVFAPSGQMTAAGRSLHGKQDAYFKKIDYPVNGTVIKAGHCDCSPARVVLHGLYVLFDEYPDLIVSGCNYGENLGCNVTVSGTVGAALQAASVGIPALAVSLETSMKDHYVHTRQEWATAQYFTHFFAEMILGKAFPHDVDVLNVNIPASATEETEWRLASLSRQTYFSNHIKNPAPDSRLSEAECRYGFDEETLEPESDIKLFKSGYVTVTPLSLDLTSRIGFKTLDSFLRK